MSSIQSFQIFIWLNLDLQMKRRLFNYCWLFCCWLSKLFRCLASVVHFHARDSYFLLRVCKSILVVSWVWNMPPHPYLSQLISHIMVVYNFLLLFIFEIHFKLLEIYPWLLIFFLMVLTNFIWLPLSFQLILNFLRKRGLKWWQCPLTNRFHHIWLGEYFRSNLFLWQDSPLSSLEV